MPVNQSNKNFHPQVVRWDGTNIDEVAERLGACHKRMPREAM